MRPRPAALDETAAALDAVGGAGAADGATALAEAAATGTAPVTPAVGAPPGRQGTFASLAVPAWRLYLSGQAISLVGTWMQTVGQGWLVLQLSHSGTALGLVTAAQFVPVLLLGPYGGLLADRLPKRLLLVATQTVLGLTALALGLLTVTGAVTLPWVIALALVLGCANAIDNPTRQSFVSELAGPGLVRNAVTLNSVLVNGARAVGPAVAGLLIAGVGVGWCFLANAASYLAVLVVLHRLGRHALFPSEPTRRAKGQLREGLAYVRRTPALLAPLLMMALVGMLTYEFQVTLPILAQSGLHGGADTYGLLTGAMGVGAIVGGLVVARLAVTGLPALVGAAAAFGAAVGLAAVAPGVPLELLALTLVGAASIAFLSAGNTTLQLTSDPGYRGRVMALWSVAFLGSTPIGGPVAGYISQHLGPRWGLGMGALACCVAALGGLAVIVRTRRAAPAA